MHHKNNLVESPLDTSALSVLHSLRRQYPQDAEKIDFVIARFQNLQAEPAANLQEYYVSPRGPLRVVVQNMRHARVAEHEIIRQLRAYQKWIAGAIETHAKSGELYKRLNYLISR